jgi:hypothetical protein
MSFLAGCSAEARKVRNRGEALFVGREPLKAAIRGHQGALPSDVVRCRNCHGPENLARADAVAPRIDRSWLVEARQRRGGPPSSYDSGTFCNLLRTGIDPVYVLIGREMPNYVVDDAQCASLWAFLTDQVR